MISCVIYTLITVLCPYLCKRPIGGKVINVGDYKRIERKSVLGEEATHTCEKECRHGIIQTEQFSEPDSNPDSVEMGQNPVRFDYQSSVP